MMNRLTHGLLAALCLAVAASCGGREESDASRAALGYFRCLMEGRYEDYVNGIAYSDSMTDAYRNQMVDLVAAYAARERGRGGLSGVRALRDTVVGDMASVFLEVTFGDSTCEEISVPMVKCGKEWKMQ